MRNKKRLSKEYMELLKRNQGSINKVESVVESTETALTLIDCEDKEIEVKKINETEETDTVIVFEEKDELVSSDENNLQVFSVQEEEAPEYVSEINDNESDNIKDQREHNEPDDNIVIEKHLVRTYLRRAMKSLAPETPKRRRRGPYLRCYNSSTQSSFPTYDKLMKVVREERWKHMEMITALTNTTFALERRPGVEMVERRNRRRRHKHAAQDQCGAVVLSYQRPKQLDQQNRSQITPSSDTSKPWTVKANGNVSSPINDKRCFSVQNKSVHFGSLVTFDDASTPVPIRPERRNKTGLFTQVRQVTLRNEKSENIQECPARPRRSYKCKEITPLTLTLLPLNYHNTENIPGKYFKFGFVEDLNDQLCLFYRQTETSNKELG